MRQSNSLKCGQMTTGSLIKNINMIHMLLTHFPQQTACYKHVSPHLSRHFFSNCLAERLSQTKVVEKSRFMTRFWLNWVNSVQANGLFHSEYRLSYSVCIKTSWYYHCSLYINIQLKKPHLQMNIWKLAWVRFIFFSLLLQFVSEHYL